MIRKFILAMGAVLALCGPVCAAPLEVYGKLPTIEQTVVSPTGNLVAFVTTNGDTRSIVVEDPAKKQVLFKGAVGVARLVDVTWAGDQRLILTVATARQPAYVTGPRVEYYMPMLLDLTSGHVKPLLHRIKGVQDALDSSLGIPTVRTVDGKPVVFVPGEHFVSNQGQVGLFKVDLDTGDAHLIENGDNGVYDWLIDEHGQPVAREGYNDRSGVTSLWIHQGSGWRKVDRVDSPIDRPDLVGVSTNGKAVVVDFGDETTGSSWVELSLDTVQWGASTTNASGESAILDPQTGRILGKYALVGDVHRYTFFDPHDAAVWAAVVKAFPGDAVTLQSWSDDRKKIAVLVDSAELGPAFALVDLNTGQADWLGDEYSGLKTEDIAPVKAIRYKAADGTEITGYLTLPRGRDPHNLALVVLAHGGPAARDTPGFDWWAQALASKGYAVLQPNFRGSDGFGWSFLSSGFGQIGRKMQTDLSDGVRDLAKQGTIDPKRVCIVGASYGGYAALAGATIDHGVYRCAVSVSGVADLKGLAADFGSKQGQNAERYWFRFVGAKDGGDPVILQYSPLHRAAEADIPILLIHGKDDTVVPISQSRQMASALQGAGKSVELIELAGEDHHLRTGATRLQMLQATVDFLEKYNPSN
jgi:dienelactone hydrolase